MIPVESADKVMVTFAFHGNAIFAANPAGTVFRKGRDNYAPTAFSLVTHGFRAGITDRSNAGVMLNALVRTHF